MIKCGGGGILPVHKRVCVCVFSKSQLSVILALSVLQNGLKKVKSVFDVRSNEGKVTMSTVFSNARCLSKTSSEHYSSTDTRKIYWWSNKEQCTW